jgi:hypothetical protein
MPIQLSLSKFLSFLSTHNLTARLYFCDDSQIKYVECVCIHNGHPFMMYISSKYKIPIPTASDNVLYMKQVEDDSRLEDYLSSVSSNLTCDVVSISNMYFHIFDTRQSEFTTYSISSYIKSDNTDDIECKDDVSIIKEEITKIEDTINEDTLSSASHCEEEILEFDIADNERDTLQNNNTIEDKYKYDYETKNDSILGLILICIDFVDVFVKSKSDVSYIDTRISDYYNMLYVNEKQHRDREYLETDIELSNLLSRIKEKYENFESQLSNLISKRSVLTESIIKIDNLLSKVTEAKNLLDKKKDAYKLLCDTSYEVMRKKDKYDEFIRNINFHLSSINSLFSLIEE